MKKLAFLFLMLLAVTMSMAQTISVQGVLRDPNGRSVNDGFHNITFSIYNVLDGGTALWSENYPSLETVHGVFQANLGANTPFGNLPFDETYYVGVKVDNYPEMSPRIILSIYPYSKAILGQENKFPSTGNVVLERDSIIVKQGALKLQGPDGVIVFNDGTTLNTANLSGPASALLNPTSVNINAANEDPNIGNINFQFGGVNKAVLYNSGKLEVNSDDFFAARLKSTSPVGTSLEMHSDAHNWELTAAGTDNGGGANQNEFYIYDQTVGAKRMTIDGSGEVNIGGRLNAGFVYSSDILQAANSLLANYGHFGSNDLTGGGASFYGSATGEGAELDLYTSGEFDDIIDYYYLDIIEDDFRIGGLGYGDIARFTAQGKVGIGYNAPTSRLHVSNFTALSLSNPGALTLGNDDASNIVFDDNDIQARNNGIASSLYLNTYGGAVYVGAEGSNSSALIVGKNDGSDGVLVLQGDDITGEGGEIQLYNSAAHDDNFEFWYINTYEDDLRLGSAGGVSGFGDLLTLAANGNVGIGTNNPIAAKLQIEGSMLSSYQFFNAVGNSFATPNESLTFYSNELKQYSTSIQARERIVGAGFNTFSDRRIKKNIAISNSAEDLEVLKSIEITNYKKIDTISDNNNYKKVIAQQVKSVYPDAVNLTQDYIPNVYKLAESVTYENDLVHISLDEPHTFEVGNQVKIVIPGEELNVEVISIADEKTFSIRTNQKLGSDVFVFGKLVDDFHMVDYEAISMLNVSATQELAKMVEAQKLQIAKLEAENATLKAKMEKVDALEAKLNVILGIQEAKTVEATLVGKD